MSLKNQLEVQRCSDKVWDLFLQEDTSSTFFQSRTWFEITASSIGFTPHPIFFKLNNEETVLPLIKNQKVFTFYTSPFGTYTGLLSPVKLSQNFIKKIVSYLNSQNIRIFTNPFSPNTFKLSHTHSLPTFTIDLTTSEMGFIHKTWKKGHRDNLRMAQKKGVQIKLGTSQKDVSDYYQVYLSTTKRWQVKGSTSYNEALLQKLIKICVPQKTAKLWLCVLEGKVIAGVLVFYLHKHMVAWHGAADADYYKYYPNQFIYHHILEDGKESGFEFFDFNPSQDLPGVKKFKAGFTAKETPAHITHHYNLPYKIMTKLRGG